ncbi:MAG TPA: TonB family protein [Luteitalea sp.]|nr:TonB family protein [Luteitalea sp.]
MSRREAVLLSVFLHGGLILLFLFGPRLPFIREFLEAEQQRQQEAQQQALQQQQQAQQQRPRFVFVQPKMDMQSARPKQNAELADADRTSRTTQRAPNATNDQPFSKGNSLEFVERTAAKDLAKGKGPAPEPSESPREMQAQQARNTPPTQTPPQAQPTPTAPANNQGVNMREGQSGLLARGDTGVVAPPQARSAPASPASPATRPPGGSLGQALRNLEKYTQNEAFNNPNGGNSPFGPYIQFDTKGVEFGPWIRRFVAQIKRNWLIPEAAMVMKGHVVVTFNVHKDGRITDIAIKQPSGIDAFDRAAANSLQWSNPTTPLPPEYPSPVAQFTVTFYYNEQPPSQ